MGNNEIKANVSMFVARMFSGLNMNAMKLLLPLWIAPLSCVTLRLLFGTIVFWTIGIFEKPDTSTTADRIKLLLIGAIAVYGYMSLYAIGISLTTPINLAIFNAMQPIWVFIISAMFMGEKVTYDKIAGISVGFLGAILCSLSQPDESLASNPILGNSLGLICSICYAVYIVMSENILKRVSNMVMLRYTFLGATITSLIVTGFIGFDAPLFNNPIQWQPITALVYILLFPTILSYLLIPIGMKYLKATVVAIYGYLTLFIATVTSLLLGQDKFDDTQLTALALMCLGIYWVSVAERKKSKYDND